MTSSTSSNKKTPLPLVNDFLSFLHSTPSQFHVVQTASRLLTEAGFTAIKETDDDWNGRVKAAGKYFYTRNQSSLIAFATPPSFTLSATSTAANQFTILAAHTDSPVLKVKPVSKVSKHGYLQVGVEPYGGGLWHTWFDRDLSLAGRVIVSNSNNTFTVRLINIRRPILRIPTLAIHLSRDVNDKGFAPNKQNHLLPVLATQVQQQLNAPATTTDADKAEKAEKADNTDKQTADHFSEHHHSVLLQLLADELGLRDVAAIRDFELCLYDTQLACTGGLNDEFIFSRALDNQCMSFISLCALIDSTKGSDWSEAAVKAAGETIRVVALFDNEEVGSVSEHGAASNMMQQFFTRLNPNPSTLPAAIRRSLLVSADMAHAVHPNYADVHEENHRPQLHKGLVIKQNANQRYATTNVLQFILTELARRHNIGVQQFVVRNDSGCGSTIGPMMSAACGIRTIDVGIPQLSMHSIREMCGTRDVEFAKQFFQHTFNEFHALDQSIQMEGGEQ